MTEDRSIPAELITLLRDAGGEVLQASPILLARWRGLRVTANADTDPSRLRDLLSLASDLPDPLPTAEISLVRHSGDATSPYLAPNLSVDAARVVWELSGDSTFLYFDRDRSAMTILGRDAAGRELSLEHRMASVNVDDHAALVRRNAREIPTLVTAGDPDREPKRRRIRERLVCVRCVARPPLIDRDDRLACPGCDATYPVIDGIPILLVDPSTSPEPGDGDVSSNAYSRQALALVDRFRDGMVLDCGCGRPGQSLRNVVSVEIFRYPNVDVVASGDALPFRDETFDGVICESVLEHVPDPWRVVNEVDRTLKRGGALLFDVPFLAPFHGFPNHFHNFTQSGLRRILSRFDEIECGIQPHQEPWVAIGWILRLLREGLPDDDARKRFDVATLGEMLTGVAIARPPEALANIDDATRRALAAGFTFFGRKR